MWLYPGLGLGLWDLGLRQYHNPLPECRTHTCFRGVMAAGCSSASAPAPALALHCHHFKILGSPPSHLHVSLPNAAPHGPIPAMYPPCAGPAPGSGCGLDGLWCSGRVSRFSSGSWKETPLLLGMPGNGMKLQAWQKSLHGLDAAHGLYFAYPCSRSTLTSDYPTSS